MPNIDTDDAIIGDLREQITAPPKTDKLTIPDNLPHGGVEGVRPVKLRELPPMPSDYRLKRTSKSSCAWWALPYGVYDYIRQRKGKLREDAQAVLFILALVGAGFMG